MSIVKALGFPVHAHWKGERLVSTRAPAKDVLQVATPPEFRGGVEGIWSPEELVVAATATCYTLTLAAVAERRGVQLDDIHVNGTGHISRRDDNRYGFVGVDLDAEIVASVQALRAAQAAAEEARERCIVSSALDVPVHVRIGVRPAAETTHFLGSGVAS